MKLVFRSELFNLTLWLCHIISLLWSMLSMCSFSSITGVIRNNRVREMAFELFLPSVLSVFTSSHFQEEELPEKRFWVNPAQCFFSVKLKSDIKVSGNCFSSPPARCKGNDMKLKETIAQSSAFHLIFHTNLRSGCGLVTSKVYVTLEQ